MAKTTKGSTKRYASRSNPQRRARKATRDYLRAAMTLNALPPSASKLARWVAEQECERAALTLEKATKITHVHTSMATPCTAGHAMRCALGLDDDCDCACEGSNHGIFTSKLTKNAMENVA